MEQRDIISIYDGIKTRKFRLTSSPQNLKYLFTAYSDRGEYFDCFESADGNGFCTAADPRESTMKNMEFVKSSGFSMNCQFYNML